MFLRIQIRVWDMFAENLKTLRIEHNLTQVDLAKIIGVSQTTIYFWETGTNEPTLSYLVRLASFFEITIDELIGETFLSKTMETTITKYYKLPLKDRGIVDNLIDYLCHEK